MATKKSFFVLLGLFFITAGFLGFANGVCAETLKLQVTNIVTKVEAIPIEKNEGPVFLPMLRDGVFVSENGEVGSMKFIGTAYGVAGKGGSLLGYIVYMFGDGSTIVVTMHGTSWPDPEGKLAGIQKASGEIINGSGRFKGIKGSHTMNGKLLKLVKGEIASKIYNEFILIYTLSP
jgi:hypothetical protein